MSIKEVCRIFKVSGAAGVIISAALLLSSCKALTGRHRMYPGPERPQEEVAVLRSVRDCQILSVDGTKVTHSSLGYRPPAPEAVEPLPLGSATLRLSATAVPA